MDIFDRVKMLANRQNMSVSQLEQKLGYGNGSLYPHSKNATIRGDRVVELANYFGVSTDWLLTGETGIKLSYGEWELLDKYRGMDDELQRNLKSYLDFLDYKKHTKEGE